MHFGRNTNSADRYPGKKEVSLSALGIILMLLGTNLPIPIVAWFFIEQLGWFYTAILSIGTTIIYYGICWWILATSERLTRERLDRYRGIIIEIGQNKMSSRERALLGVVVVMFIINVLTSNLPSGLTLLQTAFSISGQFNQLSIVSGIISTICLLSLYRLRTRRLGLL